MRHLRASMRRTFLALVVGALAFAGAQPAALAAPPSVDVTMGASDTRIAKGEMVWFKGKVRTRSGKGVKGVKVRLERLVGDGRWVKVATLRSKANGSFSLRQRPDKRYTYRARALASAMAKKAVGPERKIRYIAGNRTLEQRAELLGKRLGTARGAESSLKAGTTTVTHQNFSKMLLVEVAKKSKVRTSLVYGDIRKAYLKAGGPEGKLGAPLADPKCGLFETGCVQRFKGGAIYDNASTKKASVVRGKGRKTEVLAAGLAQVGFAEKRNNTSKYNKWTKTLGQPWCSAFQSWVAAASGNPDVVPKHARLHQLVRDLKKSSPERFGSKPKVGALVFFDNDDDGVLAPTHIGLVLKVRSSSIVTIEGNTTNPATGRGRGVYQKVRTLSHPVYYWYPEY